MAKHTPGPWAFGGSLVSARGCINVALALHSWGGESKLPRDYDRTAPEELAEHAANAKLIAAAPDLLAACEAALAALPRFSPRGPGAKIVNQVKDAIAKAHGND